MSFKLLSPFRQACKRLYSTAAPAECEYIVNMDKCQYSQHDLRQPLPMPSRTPLPSPKSPQHIPYRKARPSFPGISRPHATARQSSISSMKTCCKTMIPGACARRYSRDDTQIESSLARYSPSSRITMQQEHTHQHSPVFCWAFVVEASTRVSLCETSLIKPALRCNSRSAAR